MQKIFYYALGGLIVLLTFVLVILNVFDKDDKRSDLVTLKVGEVTHSAFYAPLYVAIENGYFEEEGIEVDLTLISGANNVTAAVLSGDVEIGFCGPEATIYIYNGGEKDYIQTFAGLTKRDGQFIVSRENIKDFKWSDLEGKEVLAGRTGGMPLLNFENALKNAKIDKTKVDVNTSVDFASLTSAFIAGTGDFVNLFEPNATKLASMGYGYVLTSIGKMSGEMPYTAFNAKKSYIEENKDIVEKFTNAIYKGLQFTQKNESKIIAETIIDQFPDTSINDLITIVDRYKGADSWLATPYIEEELFNNLQDVMIDAKQIKEYVPYENLVINVYVR